MTYSCGVWPVGRRHARRPRRPSKYELVSRKLGLEPGMRLLDVGCGWGGMVMHAARHHGVHAVGVTLSHAPGRVGATRGARRRARRTGSRSACRTTATCTTGRSTRSARSACSSTSARRGSTSTSRRCSRLVRPGGRLLNHGIARPASSRARPRFAHRGFIDRYVFPDGELHEVGSVVSRIQHAGFEARHVESLREHYALTLRAWVRNLEARGREAVAEVGAGRARVWRLYMAASAVNFEAGSTQIHQVLAVRDDNGDERLRVAPRLGTEPTRKPRPPIRTLARENHEPRRRSGGARVRGSSGGRSFSVGIVSPSSRACENSARFQTAITESDDSTLWREFHGHAQFLRATSAHSLRQESRAPESTRSPS